jgi:hypothetical protein
MAALATVIHAAREAEVAEQADKEAETHVAKSAQALSDAETRYRESLPKSDFVSEMRRVSEQQRRAALGLEPLPPVTNDGDAKLAAAVKKAGAALERARAAGYEVKNDLRSKRGALAEALQSWKRSHAQTPEQHVREHLARQQKLARDFAEGKIETAPEPAPISHLDATLQAGRSHGLNAINQGAGRKYAKRAFRGSHAR